MYRYIRDVARRMVSVVQALTPSSAGGMYAGYIFPHTLSDSITYIVKPSATKFDFTIGVDADNWTSDTYERSFVAAYRKEPPWGTVSENRNTILNALHEYWDIITVSPPRRVDEDGLNKMGLPPPQVRAQQKNTAMERPYGLPVGGKFIYRGVKAVWDNVATDRLAKLTFESLFRKELNTGALGAWYNQLKGEKQAFIPDVLENQRFTIANGREWL